MASETLKQLKNLVFPQRLLENLINDLLDLAKSENNTLSFNNEFFDLTDVIQEVFKVSGYVADDKNITLRAKIDSRPSLDLIKSIKADKLRLA